MTLPITMFRIADLLPKPAQPPWCSGCTGPHVKSHALVRPVPAAYRIVGVAFELDLCSTCCENLVKSIAARFMLYDGKRSRELMRFFAVDLPKPRRKRRPRRKPVIDVIETKQLVGDAEATAKKRA